MTPTWFEHATFWSGVRRATVAPRSLMFWLIQPYLNIVWFQQRAGCIRINFSFVVFIKTRICKNSCKLWGSLPLETLQKEVCNSNRVYETELTSVIIMEMTSSVTFSGCLTFCSQQVEKWTTRNVKENSFFHRLCINWCCKIMVLRRHPPCYWCSC